VLKGPDGAILPSELLVAFEEPKKIKFETIHDHSFEVFIRTRQDDQRAFLTACFCKVIGLVEPVMVEKADCNTTKIVVIGENLAPGTPVNGMRFRPLDRNSKGKTTFFDGGEYEVRIDGNFILGADQIEIRGEKVFPALDGNHFAPGLRGSPKRCPSGDAIEGGVFRSWFSIGGQPGGDLNPNA
jgi:hypothetical protein